MYTTTPIYLSSLVSYVKESVLKKKNKKKEFGLTNRKKNKKNFGLTNRKKNKKIFRFKKLKRINKKN
jgi:hypothetical protein